MTPCLEWERALNVDGYGVSGPKGKQHRVHRWVWEEAHGPIPEGMVVMHLCDNRACYALDHLRLGTPAENSADMKAKGRQARGERVGGSKLTEDQVREIYASAELGVEVASIYGVTPQTISHIRTGQTWTHITQEEK